MTKSFYDLVPSAPKGRYDGIERPYSIDDVKQLRGSFPIEYTLATRGANRLWDLLHSEDQVSSLGALSGNQAMQMVIQTKLKLMVLLVKLLCHGILKKMLCIM